MRTSRQPREDSVTPAYERLRAAILTGSLAPGQPVSQTRLAADLGIGRGPLREALNRLAAERLVTGDFNHQMRVSALDLDDFDQIYEMRIALEPVGVAATVPTLGPSAATQLTELILAIDKAIESDDAEAFRKHHRSFHLGLTAGAGKRIHGVLADLWDHSERYRISYLHRNDGRSASATGARLRLSQIEHRQILDAALVGDADACSAALVAHLQRTLKVVFAEATEAPRIRVAPEALNTQRRDRDPARFDRLKTYLPVRSTPIPSPRSDNVSSVDDELCGC